jgi:hypothetical protein
VKKESRKAVEAFFNILLVVQEGVNSRVQRGCGSERAFLVGPKIEILKIVVF